MYILPKLSLKCIAGELIYISSENPQYRTQLNNGIIRIYLESIILLAKAEKVEYILPEREHAKRFWVAVMYIYIENSKSYKSDYTQLALFCLRMRVLGKKASVNFKAKYTNGNGFSRVQGIRNYHINIRSLSNKVSEVKSLIKQVDPHIFGISETEIRRRYNFNENSLKTRLGCFYVTAILI